MLNRVSSVFGLSFSMLDSVNMNDGSTTNDNSTTVHDDKYSGLAKQLAGEPSAFRNKIARKPVFGLSKKNKSVKSVKTVRTLDIIVSRLDPATTDEELVDWVREMKEDIEVIGVKCNRLKSKYENLYTSYHVATDVDSAVMCEAIDLLVPGPMGHLLKDTLSPMDHLNSKINSNLFICTYYKL